MKKSDFGIKMKCENCKYSHIKEIDRRIKEIYCRKLNNSLSTDEYKKMKVCLFFEKTARTI